VAEALPGARLVKAFDILLARDLASKARPDLSFDERPALPMSGDDIDAKQIVAELVRQIGFGPIDIGWLREGGSSSSRGPSSTRA
jgi:hypothetical protein